MKKFKQLSWNVSRVKICLKRRARMIRTLTGVRCGVWYNHIIPNENNPSISSSINYSSPFTNFCTLSNPFLTTRSTMTSKSKPLPQLRPTAAKNSTLNYRHPRRPTYGRSRRSQPTKYSRPTVKMTVVWGFTRSLTVIIVVVVDGSVTGQPPSSYTTRSCKYFPQRPIRLYCTKYVTGCKFSILTYYNMTLVDTENGRNNR